MRSEKDPLAYFPTDDDGERHDRGGSGARASDEVESSARAKSLPDVPAAWLDQLLLTLCDLPIDEGEGAVARAVVDGLATVFPECAAAICWADPEGRTLRTVHRFPSGSDPRLAGDASRLFPSFRSELVIRASVEGAVTLHLGSPSGLHDQERAAFHVLQRASLGFSRAVLRARDQSATSLVHDELAGLRGQIVQAEKLATLGQMAAGMVHELNNPLTSILAYTDVLARRARARAQPEADEIEWLGRIDQSAERMLRFTRDLFSYARPSSEAAAPIAIHMVLDQALAFCEHVLGEAGATTARRYATDIPVLSGMFEQLTQVFVNLITNACHAMAAGQGRLVITTEWIPSTGHLQITVEDNGPGIDPVHLPRIFVPFFTTKGDGRGTGLGLSIVRNIVEAHGGEVRASNVEPHGARFTLRLPAAEP